MKILVVDDDASLLLTLVANLEMEGFERDTSVTEPTEPSLQ